jgi:hypothetical protein
MTCTRTACLSAGWLLLALGSRCVADETEAVLRERWQRAYQSIAESIQMRRGERPLSLHKSPLLFYTNPVRQNDQHGSIYLWTEEGRPAVFASIWSALHRNNPADRNVTHEWHSLVESGDLQATRDGQVLWTSGEAGIAGQLLQETPAPAASRAARLVQMRSIARGLSANIEVEGESELRLMPQPLYRYSEGVANASDGALFVFAMSTDPELIMLLEAGDGRQPAWRVAFARFGNRPMTVADGQRILWSCGAGTPYQRAGKYYLMWRAERMAADPAQSR